MADEEIVVAEEAVKSPEVAQPELPLAEVTEEAAPETVAEVVEEPKPEEQKSVQDWRDKELKKKHAQLMEARRKAEEDAAKIATLEALAAAGGNTEQPKPNLQPTISQAEIDAAADRKLAQQRYNEDCNKAASEGEKAFPDWKDAVQNLETLGGFDMETMNGILASDNPAKALYELGKNPENYHRIMELSPARRIIEIGKIAMAPVQAKKVSEAPPPVKPVGGRAAPAAQTTITDDMDDDKAYAILKAQRKKRFEEMNGIRR